MRDMSSCSNSEEEKREKSKDEKGGMKGEEGQGN